MLEYNGFFVSLDKIRFTCKLQKQKHPRINNRSIIRNLCEFGLPSFIIIDKFFETYANNSFRYNYTLKLKDEKEGAFFVGEWWNGGFNSNEDYKKFVIEFNPNKQGLKIYNWFKGLFIFKILEIKYIDIAFDREGYSVADTFIDTKCDIMRYGTVNNHTTYISPKEKDSGRIKIYNKDIERKTKDVELNKTLRIECSIKCKGLDFDKVIFSSSLIDTLKKCCQRLNSVYIRGRPINDDWQLYLLSSVTDEHRNVALSMMSSVTKRKYKSALAEQSFNLNIDCFSLSSLISSLIRPFVERIVIK